MHSVSIIYINTHTQCCPPPPPSPILAMWLRFCGTGLPQSAIKQSKKPFRSLVINPLPAKNGRERDRDVNGGRTQGAAYRGNNVSIVDRVRRICTSL